MDVLRVDRVLAGGCRRPIGMWSQFADHGTVNKYTFHYYNEDHHAAAMQTVEAALRTAAAKACVAKKKAKAKARKRKRTRPRRRRHPAFTAAAPSTASEAAATAPNDVVDVYGNSDEGDMSAGLTRSGPAAADYVGRTEAAKFLEAWKAAGSTMTTSPALDSRWTRVCFCGQGTDVGPVASSAEVGLPLITGSEEGRGPLYDVTHVAFEGDHSPLSVGPQGDKLPVVPDAAGTTPKAFPLAALRIGDGLIVSIPGEMTEEMGKRVRASVLAAVGSAGISHVVLSGLANEYISYFTTPEEYDRQHYEGGSTLYGRASSEVLKQNLTDLARDLAQGQPAPAPYAYDPTNGLSADSPPFPDGATAAGARGQPGTTPRLERATFSWQGGPKGYDRPLDRPFVTIRQRVGSGWQAVDSDLGLNVLWSVDDNGVYQAEWEAPVSAPLGTYSFLITGRHYTLESGPFQVTPTTRLVLSQAQAPAGRLGVTIGYPAAVPEQDLTYRPAIANAGSVTFDVAGRRVTVARPAHGGLFSVPVPAAGTVSIAMGGAQDRYGNANASALVLRP